MPANDCSPSKGQDSIDSELDELPDRIGEPVEPSLTDVELDFTSDVSSISPRPESIDGDAWVHLDVELGFGKIESAYTAEKARELAEEIVLAAKLAEDQQGKQE